MMQKNHKGGKLWATEFGWGTFQNLKEGSHVDGKPAMPPSDPSIAWMTVLTENQQAVYIIRAFDLAENSDIAGFMGPMFLWNMNFASLKEFTTSSKPSQPEAGYSVLN